MIDLKTYFYGSFSKQLRDMLLNADIEPTRSGKIWFGENGWKTFNRDIATVPMTERAFFLLFLFMIVMTDQALYRYEQKVYSIWKKNTNFPKLGHEGFGSHNENPFIILAKASSDEALKKEMISSIPEFALFLIDETESFFHKLFNDTVDLTHYFNAIINDSAYKLTGYKSQGNIPEIQGNEIVACFQKHFEEALNQKGLL